MFSIDSSCLSNPCLNGGQCVDTDEEDILYFCNCISGFGGKNCNEIITSCTTTTSTSTSGSCLNQTFTSSSCSQSKKCQNGGTCNTTISQCVCGFGYSGNFCENCNSYFSINYLIVNFLNYSFNFGIENCCNKSLIDSNNTINIIHYS